MDNIKPLLGKCNLTVAEAMRLIDQNACGILFLTDDSDLLLGCITDGDIRRFILGGGDINDLSTCAANPKPRYARNIEEARTLFHNKDYIAIPVIDNNGRIIDIYKGDSDDRSKRRKPINLPVVINAGGKGTRLDPLTKVLPKPLIPIGDLPIIEHIMREYQLYACNDFHIIVNYKRELLKAYFAENESKYNITWYDEIVPLGTGGGLSLLKGQLEETFFFANCDALLKANYESMLRFHKENGNIITMICAYKNLSIPYGVIEMGLNGTIENMEEKPFFSFLTNTGIYIVEPDVLYDIKDNTSVGFPDIVEMEKNKGRKVAAFPVSENDWMDMGQFPELEKMRKSLYGE